MHNCIMPRLLRALIALAFAAAISARPNAARSSWVGVSCAAKFKPMRRAAFFVTVSCGVHDERAADFRKLSSAL